MGACRDFCIGFAKTILIVLNVLIVISATCLITTAIMYSAQSSGLDVKGISTAVIVVGLFVGIIAFLGCCGAIKENPCMLTIYSGLLLFFFILQIILAIIAFAVAGNGQDGIEKGVTEVFVKLYNNTEEQYETDYLQSTLQCCGLRGPNGTEVQDKDGKGIVRSCCDFEAYECTVQNAYKEGCVETVTDIIIASLFATGAVSMVFGIIELFIALFAFCVRGDIKKDRNGFIRA